jgi:methyl-accepting chemotaxis protein
VKKKYKRKLGNYIVDKELQIRIIAGSLIFMLAAVIVTLTIIMYPLFRDMFSNDMDTQYRAAQTFLILVKRMVPAVILLLLLFVLHLIIVTHRICGPLVNFRHTFLKLKEGNLSRRIYLRQGDYLKKECELINGMIDGLSGIVSRIMEDQKKLISNLEEMISKTQDLDTKEKLEEALRFVTADARYVMETLTRFHIENGQSKSKPE